MPSMIYETSVWAHGTEYKIRRVMCQTSNGKLYVSRKWWTYYVVIRDGQRIDSALQMRRARKIAAKDACKKLVMS